MITREEAKRRVGRGAAFMDRQYAGWAERIDTGLLDLFYDEHCILGQIAPPFQDTVTSLWGCYVDIPWVLDLDICMEQTLGFMGDDDEYDDEALLQDEWIVAIAERVLVVSAESELTHAL